jgi:glycosyltransferase involved in cell wall biosynthesis
VAPPSRSNDDPTGDGGAPRAARPLAVFAPSVGRQTETFVRRHIDDLLPGGTIVVTDRVFPAWRPACEMLELRGRGDRMWRSVGGATRAVGLRVGRRSRRAERFLREHGARVILAEFLNYGTEWIALAARLGIPLFGHAHGHDVSARLRKWRWRHAYRLYRRAAGVITMSEASRARLVRLGLDESRIHVVPYGIDVRNTLPARPEREEVRCAVVGRLIAKKAPLKVLDAFARAARAVPALRLDYVGSGELMDEARAFVARQGLDGRVTLHGARPHDVVRRLLDDADIFLQHSIVDPRTGDEEGMPVAILEAMGHGLPVVATRHAGIPEAVVEGETGLLVGEGDSATMGEHLVTLARDAALRRRLGEAGWRRARERFTWERERRDLRRVLGLGG